MINSYFTSVGTTPSDKFPKSQSKPTKYIKKSFPNSFMFRSILENEVQEIINNVDAKKGTLSNEN